jgi:hypothetical protein
MPEPDTPGISSDVQVDLCMSTLVDPRTVTDADATLSSGASRFDSTLSVQLVPWTGPGGTPLPEHTEHPWCRGSVLSITPRSPLPPGVLYRARLRPAPTGWSGERLDTDAPGWIENEDGDVHYIVELMITEPGSDDAVDGEEVGTAAPTLRDLFAPGGVFDPELETCGCHGEVGEVAHALLDMRTADSAFEHLVVRTRRRDTGFPMVTPRRPSESFLLHKLLRDEQGEPIDGVLGGPMPPDHPLPYRDLVQIIRWIEAGAAL